MSERAITSRWRWLRNRLDLRPGDERIDARTCCVGSCSRPSMILVAGQGASSKWACTRHARAWIASAACLAAQSDPVRSFTHFTRWAATLGRSEAPAPAGLDLI